jgi:YVTN family beta-propeller protein
VVDAESHEVIREIQLGYNENVKPVGIIVSPDGNKIYVANGRGNSVSVIDAGSFQILKTIPVGQRVWGIALTPDGRKLYAGNGLSNDVSVVDTRTDSVVNTIKAGDGPWGVAVRPAI